jgi:very-short-patch-repair endonuclease
MNEEKIFTNPKLKDRRRELRNNMTKAEVLLWLELKGKKMKGYKFRRQHSIGYYVVDFYCTKLKLAIEVDGATHLSDEEIKHDKEKEYYIKSLGIAMQRFTNQEIYEDMMAVLDKIISKIGEIECSLPA